MKKLFFALSCTVVLNNFAQVPTTGLLAFYPFSGNTNDSSAMNYDAQAGGGSFVTDRFGNANAAFYLNGSTDSLVFPIPGFTPITGDFCISFWLKSS